MGSLEEKCCQATHVQSDNTGSFNIIPTIPVAQGSLDEKCLATDVQSDITGSFRLIPTIPAARGLQIRNPALLSWKTGKSIGCTWVVHKNKKNSWRATLTSTFLTGYGNTGAEGG